MVGNEPAGGRFMRLTIMLCGALLMLGGAGGATAAPVDYDCDTAEGSFSQLSQRQAGPAYHVRGTITPLQWREHERWMASAQVRLETRDRSRLLAVQVIRGQGAARAEFAVTVNSGSGPHSTTLGDIALNETVPFDISLLATGDAVVQLGTERRVFHLDLGRDLQVNVICSTGEFLFGELDLGG